jgi:hypothetical protein
MVVTVTAMVVLGVVNVRRPGSSAVYGTVPNRSRARSRKRASGAAVDALE